jgi:hypothetical protein
MVDFVCVGPYVLFTYRISLEGLLAVRTYKRPGITMACFMLIPCTPRSKTAIGCIPRIESWGQTFFRALDGELWEPTWKQNSYDRLINKFYEAVIFNTILFNNKKKLTGGRCCKWKVSIPNEFVCVGWEFEMSRFLESSATQQTFKRTDLSRAVFLLWSTEQLGIHRLSREDS